MGISGFNWSDYGHDKKSWTNSRRSERNCPSAAERQPLTGSTLPGKLTAWERMDLLFDPGTFRELDLLARPFKTGFDIDNRDLPRDAIVVGYGSVNGRTVYASCYDYTVAGGSQGSMQMMKLVKVMEQARKEGLPYVTIIDSTGRRNPGQVRQVRLPGPHPC